MCYKSHLFQVRTQWCKWDTALCVQVHWSFAVFQYLWDMYGPRLWLNGRCCFLFTVTNLYIRPWISVHFFCYISVKLCHTSPLMYIGEQICDRQSVCLCCVCTHRGELKKKHSCAYACVCVSRLSLSFSGWSDKRYLNANFSRPMLTFHLEVTFCVEKVPDLFHSPLWSPLPLSGNWLQSIDRVTTGVCATHYYTHHHI